MNQETQAPVAPEISDMEIVAHLYRMARTGAYDSRQHLMLSAKEDFPEFPMERIEKCMQILANRLS